MKKIDLIHMNILKRFFWNKILDQNIMGKKEQNAKK